MGVERDIFTAGKFSLKRFDRLGGLEVSKKICFCHPCASAARVAL